MKDVKEIDAIDKKLRLFKKRGYDMFFFHKSQKSERTQDHEIAILDGDLKTSTMILENFQVQCWTKIQRIDFISHENILGKWYNTRYVQKLM